MPIQRLHQSEAFERPIIDYGAEGVGLMYVSMEQRRSSASPDLRSRSGALCTSNWDVDKD